MRISANALIRGFRGSAGIVLILAMAVVATGARAELLHGGTQASDAGLTGNSIASGNTSRNLAVGADGTIYTVFRGANGIRVARSGNRGASFDPSVQISSVNAEAEIAVSTTGIIFVTWSEDGHAYISRSLDGGQTFSAAMDAGPAWNSVHMATDASRVYLIDNPGNNFLASHDNGLTFSHVALDANYVFADVHVDADSGDVIVVVDNPTVRYYISTDYGQSFSAQLTSSPTTSVYYSVGALSSGSQGRFLFVAGGIQNDALRINLDTNAGSILPFGNNTQAQGRSLSADRCGNVVDGYVNDTTVEFQISNDLGVSFGSPVSVAEAAFANVFINQTNGDILFLHEQSGEIFLSVYAEELPCYSPELTLSTLVFPARLVGTTSSAQQVSITNPGENPVQVTGIQTTSDFAHFSECVGTLAAGESCAISVTFTPSDAGARSGQVQISTNVFIEPRVVTLSGEGVALAPVADFSPASLAFGNQTIGSVSAPRTVMLTNSGNESLSVDGFSIATGFNYSHDCPAELEPSQSCEIAVTFSPQEQQTYAGSLVLSSNAPGAPATVTLSGQGLVGPLEFTLTASVTSGEGTISPTSILVPGGEVAVFTLSAAAGYRIDGASGCDGSLDGASYTTAPVTGTCAVAAVFSRESPFLDVPETGEIGSGESFPVSTDAELVPGDFVVTRNGDTVAGTIQCGVDGCGFTPPSTGRYTIVISDPVSGWTHEMTISVLPHVDLAPDQWVATGDSARVTFLLDDHAIDYPVAVPYTVSGSVTSGHDATAGTLMIDYGLSAHLDINIDTGAPAGSIVIELGEPDGARRGTRIEHVIHVWFEALPPMVDLAFRQWVDGVEVPTFEVVRSQGPVTLVGLFGDLPVEALLFDWSGSDSRLAISSSGPEAVLVDVSMIDPGTYRVEFAVTTPSGIVRSAGRLLRVLADCPDTTAGDGCGIMDAAGQGLSPSDVDERHHLQVGSGDARPLRTLQGLTLRQGDAAFAARRDGAWVSQQELGAHAELGQQAHGTMPAGVFAAAYSFEIAGLASAGQSIPVVVPLRGETTIPANARWYKYRNGQGWIRFVEDADNALHSATAADGVCPGPNSASWQPGLIRGQACVRLTLQDGGPNDADGEDNGVIRDPSLLVGDHDLVVVGQSTGGGGSLHPWVLMVLGGCVLLATGRRRRDAPRDARPIRAGSLAGLLAVSVFALPATSQALEVDGGYIGATGLRTSGGASAGDIGARLAAAGYTVDTVEVDRRRAGWRAYAGYQLSPRIAVELGYVDLGRARSRVALTGEDTDAALADVLAAMPLVANGIDFGAVARQPVTDALTLMARASILRWEGERRATLADGASIRDKRRGTGVSLALGAELALGRSNWSVGIDLERNRVAGRDLDSVGLGVRYRL